MLLRSSDSLAVHAVYGPVTAGIVTATVLSRRMYWPGLSRSNSHSGTVDLARCPWPCSLQQRQRVEPRERDVLGQLVLAAVVLEVGELEPLEVEAERLAGEQALARRRPSSRT